MSISIDKPYQRTVSTNPGGHRGFEISRRAGSRCVEITSFNHSKPEDGVHVLAKHELADLMLTCWEALQAIHATGTERPGDAGDYLRQEAKKR